MTACRILFCALVAQPQHEGDAPVAGSSTLVEWNEACRLVGAHEQEIWPGYRLGEIPALIYTPNVGEFLLRHPHPPAGFARFEGKSALGDETLFVHRGKTIYSVPTFTSTDVAGVTTLAVADHAAYDASDAWYLGTMVHEGFHAWAGRHIKWPPSSEVDLADYPDVDANANAHLELEGIALLAALHAETADEREEQALFFLAERARRRSLMPPNAIAWEDHNELNEGLATYVEQRAHELWLADPPKPEVVAACGALRSPADFKNQVEQLALMLLNSSRGTFSVNGSRYGLAAVRRRGYFFGAVIGKLLDALAPDWKGRVEKGETLTALLNEALGAPADEELAERAASLERDRDFAALVVAKEQLAADARKERERRIAAVLEGEGTLLVIDVRVLAPKGSLLPSAWTPFGLLRVDAHRRLFSQSPTTFDFASPTESIRIESSEQAAVIVDEERRELLLRSPLAADELVKKLTPWPGHYADAAVDIRAPRATVTIEEPGRVRLVPALAEK